MNNDEIVIGAIRSEVPDINGGGIGRVLPISPVGAISPPGDDFARHFANVAPDAIVVDQHVRRAVPVRQFLDGGGGRIVGRLRIACRPAGAPPGKLAVGGTAPPGGRYPPPHPGLPPPPPPPPPPPFPPPPPPP